MMISLYTIPYGMSTFLILPFSVGRIKTAINTLVLMLCFLISGGSYASAITLTWLAISSSSLVGITMTLTLLHGLEMMPLPPRIKMDAKGFKISAAPLADHCIILTDTGSKNKGIHMPQDCKVCTDIVSVAVNQHVQCQGGLFICAWKVIKAHLKAVVPHNDAVPGASIAVQTYRATFRLW